MSNDEEGGGILINTTGRGGGGDLSPYMAPYGASKAGVLSFSKSIAKEYEGKPVSVFCVFPGMVDTDLIRKVETTDERRQELDQLEYVLQAFGIPVDEVGELFAELAGKKPGSESGKVFKMLKGFRMMKGVFKIIWFRMRGKL